MNSQLEQVLLRAAEETFSSMAFMFPVDGEGAPPPAGARRIVRVAFRGPRAGWLDVAVAPDMLPAIAGNMLGLEDGQAPSDAQQTDALKELGNVICGNILPDVGTPTDVFEVCAPRVLEDAAGGDDGRGLATTRASMCLDAGPAELTLVLEGDGEGGTAAPAQPLSLHGRGHGEGVPTAANTAAVPPGTEALP